MNNLIQDSLNKLKKLEISNPELDLRILLNYSSKKKNIITLNKCDLSEINLNVFNNLLQKRLKRIPISKILNRKFFWKSEFYVNSHVLDPRPETELIIEQVLSLFKDKNQSLEILDIGTGSGCLAISLSKEYINSSIKAIDVSSRALAVAKKNIKKNNSENQIQLEKIQFEKINNKFDLIVSNPPYLSEEEYLECEDEIRKFEPKIALVGGKDGLKFYEIFANKLHMIMKKNSYFICEIGYNQLSSCKKIFKNSNLKLIKTSKDIQNFDRTLTFLKI